MHLFEGCNHHGLHGELEIEMRNLFTKIIVTCSTELTCYLGISLEDNLCCSMIIEFDSVTMVVIETMFR